jgi:hypothetical protein
MPGGNVGVSKNHMTATGSYSSISELQNGVKMVAIGAELMKIQLVEKYRLNGQLVGYEVHHLYSGARDLYSA